MSLPPRLLLVSLLSLLLPGLLVTPAPSARAQESAEDQARRLLEDGRAIGVRLADGTEYKADIVISAADGHATLFDMLEGKYVDEEIQRCYDEWPIFAPIVQVSLGVC